MPLKHPPQKDFSLSFDRNTSTYGGCCSIRYIYHPTQTNRYEIQARKLQLLHWSKGKSVYPHPQFVDILRKYSKDFPSEQATHMAIDDCIEHDILLDYLLKNRAGVIAMVLYEFDIEKYKQQQEDKITLLQDTVQKQQLTLQQKDEVLQQKDDALQQKDDDLKIQAQQIDDMSQRINECLASENKKKMAKIKEL
jgi:hypothetical protein